MFTQGNGGKQLRLIISGRVIIPQHQKKRKREKSKKCYKLKFSYTHHQVTFPNMISLDSTWGTSRHNSFKAHLIFTSLPLVGVIWWHNNWSKPSSDLFHERGAMPPLFLPKQSMHKLVKGITRFTLRNRDTSGFYIGCTEEGYHKYDPTHRWTEIRCPGWKRLQISHQKSQSLALSRTHFAHRTHEQSRLVQPWP